MKILEVLATTLDNRIVAGHYLVRQQKFDWGCHQKVRIKQGIEIHWQDQLRVGRQH
jgi:hypothetical protein